MRTAKQEGGRTPPPHFLKTNTEAQVRKRGGQPGNDNARKHGQHTAQMRALRADVRLAVQEAKTLTAFAWASPPGRSGR